MVNTSGITFGGMLSRPSRMLRKSSESSTKMIATAVISEPKRSPTTASMPTEPS